jgi:hypothetical protein
MRKEEEKKVGLLVKKWLFALSFIPFISKCENLALED